MSDFITIPAPVYRAFKPLIQQRAEPNCRYAMFVRIGCTAYDFTLTFSDSFMAIRVQWPKPKEWGNAHEGECWYLNRAEFHALEYTAKYGARFEIPESYDLPFRNDILNDVAIQSFIDSTLGSYKERNGRVIPCSTKKLNAAYLAKTLKACETITRKGEHNGLSDSPLTIDFGCNGLVPALMSSYVPSLGLTLNALVMPIR